MPPIHVPTLRDGDLVLRPPSMGDADAITAACQDPEIQRWTLVPSPYHRRHAEEWLAGIPDRAREGTHANLLAELEARLAGSFSVMEIDAERGYGEIGYWVAPHARRRGVASRSVALLRDWAAGPLGLRTLEILPHRDNAPSRRVALSAGFEATGELRTPPRGERPGPPAYEVFVWQA